MDINILEEHAEVGGSMFLQKKFTLTLQMQVGYSPDTMVSIYKTTI
jgi:hypothetical protein